MKSVGPPAENGTTMLIGLEPNIWANDGAASVAQAPIRNVRRVIVIVSPCCSGGEVRVDTTVKWQYHLSLDISPRQIYDGRYKVFLIA
jgi:hypothetical protein